LKEFVELPLAESTSQMTRLIFFLSGTNYNFILIGSTSPYVYP